MDVPKQSGKDFGKFNSGNIEKDENKIIPGGKDWNNPNFGTISSDKDLSEVAPNINSGLYDQNYNPTREDNLYQKNTFNVNLPGKDNKLNK
ncbi:hypothetical protein ABK040_008082 [Willaertia magna]